MCDYKYVKSTEENISEFIKYLEEIINVKLNENQIEFIRNIFLNNLYDLNLPKENEYIALYNFLNLIGFIKHLRGGY